MNFSEIAMFLVVLLILLAALSTLGHKETTVKIEAEKSKVISGYKHTCIFCHKSFYSAEEKEQEIQLCSPICRELYELGEIYKKTGVALYRSPYQDM